MKRLLTTLTFSYLLTACGAVEDFAERQVPAPEGSTPYTQQTPERVIEDFCVPYYDLFQELTGKNPYRVSCVMVDELNVPENKKDRAVGLCSSGINGITISLLRGFWDVATESSREQLMLHELGHCTLGRKHKEEMIEMDNGAVIPRSLMTPMLFSNQIYQKYRDYYIDELTQARLLLSEEEIHAHFVSCDH